MAGAKASGDTKASEDTMGKPSLASLIKQARESGRPAEVRERGGASAMLLSKEQYDGLIATIEFQREVGKSLADVAAGRSEPWEKVRDELLSKLRAAQKASSKNAKRA